MSINQKPMNGERGSKIRGIGMEVRLLWIYLLNFGDVFVCQEIKLRRKEGELEIAYKQMNLATYQMIMQYLDYVYPLWNIF